MNDTEVDWDYVHRCNFEKAAFWDINWIANARNLFESAKRLEPEVVRIWDAYREKIKNAAAPLPIDYFQGPYFMLLAFATENLLKAAAVSYKRFQYKDEFRRSKKFPKELMKHDLIKLAQLVGLAYSDTEEDLLRRLTRSAIWFGRYPAPLDYADMSGQKKFDDGNEYTVSWFGEGDVERLNTFILGLPGRLKLDERHWASAA
ncbi:MAG: hypothetical protein ABL877_13635 [Thiobacillus sp.]